MGPIERGQAVSGSLVYDASVSAVGAIGGGLSGTFDRVFPALISFELTVGSYSASADGGSLLVRDVLRPISEACGGEFCIVRHAHSVLAISSDVEGDALGGLSLSQLSLEWLEPNAGEELPGEVALEPGFATLAFTDDGRVPRTVRVTAEVFGNSLPVAIPEPGAAILLALGSLGLGFARRRA